MEDIISEWEKLSLTAEEGTKLSLTKSKNLKRKEYVLAAKFLTRCAINVDVIGRTFKPLWRARNEFKIREVGDHVLLFIFELESDAERVLAQQPWSFDKHLVLFQCYDYKTPAKNLRFTKVIFWVQIHGLPMRLLDPEIAIELGESLVIVSEAENLKELVGNDFVCVKVEVDVSKPLCRGRKIDIGEDNDRWVSFKYKKLLNFCYWCGLVSHDEKDCEK